MVLEQQKLMKRLNAGELILGENEERSFSRALAQDIQQEQQRRRDCGEAEEAEEREKQQKANASSPCFAAGLLALPVILPPPPPEEEEEASRQEKRQEEEEEREIIQSRGTEEIVVVGNGGELPVLFGARTDSKPLTIATTVGLHVTPVKIHIRKVGGGNQHLTFTLHIATDAGLTLGFIEKGRPEFLSLHYSISKTIQKAIERLGPFPEKADFASNANGKQTGSVLNLWLKNVLLYCIDFGPLLEFLSSGVVPPPVLKESFRKQGTLAKKGNFNYL
jgi:hypothetical protein